MKGVEVVGIMGLRRRLAERIEAAFIHGIHTVVRHEKRGDARAVLVPYGWWLEHATPEERAAAGEEIRIARAADTAGRSR